MENNKNIEELINTLRNIHLSYSNIYTNSGVMSSAHLPSIDILNELNGLTSKLISQINMHNKIYPNLIDDIEGSLRVLATINELDSKTVEQTIMRIHEIFDK